MLGRASRHQSASQVHSQLPDDDDGEEEDEVKRHGTARWEQNSFDAPKNVIKRGLSFIITWLLLSVLIVVFQTRAQTSRVVPNIVFLLAVPDYTHVPRSATFCFSLPSSSSFTVCLPALHARLINRVQYHYVNRPRCRQYYNARTFLLFACLLLLLRLLFGVQYVVSLHASLLLLMLKTRYTMFNQNFGYCFGPEHRRAAQSILHWWWWWWPGKPPRWIRRIPFCLCVYNNHAVGTFLIEPNKFLTVFRFFISTFLLVVASVVEYRSFKVWRSAE